MSTGADAINCRMPKVGILTQEFFATGEKVRDRTYCSLVVRIIDTNNNIINYQQHYN